MIAFFNMRREAQRTLYSLTTPYQEGVAERDYEVIVVDSHSSEPLDGAWVESLQGNFRYRYVESPWPTPCRAMNVGIDMARADVVACAIDGARILSPGIVAGMCRLHGSMPSPFVYTPGMHLGHRPQYLSVSEGYNQQVEDALLSTLDWQANGYALFGVASLAGSAKHGLLRPIAESNCFSVSKRKLAGMGGFDERFQTIGGGLVNLDLFSRLVQDSAVEPVMLLSEATFHQFHGGASANVAPEVGRFEEFQREYLALRGEAYQVPPQQPLYFGRVRDEVRRFLDISGG